ncbi:hypothetical protein EG68_02369 [Paragonimus skrjabini miyazakii]|uniref:Uncharacterized protein n=1 Tax=Paragonimus skrjabini miyazakii TaxID=59628 RepID=A0A8S9YZ90_9TREM|nr:hypothetical protein EG68_02369 [Paragonimus skrjabini miyazakii]
MLQTRNKSLQKTVLYFLSNNLGQSKCESYRIILNA